MDCTFLCLLFVSSFAVPPGYTLFWSDEFEGSSLNGSVWNVVNEDLHWGNEMEYYTTDSVYVKDGNLVLLSQPRNMGTKNYTSGMVNSQKKFSTQYGYWEIRAILPYGQGLWPAQWLMPDDTSCWPDHGEVDIMENLGKDMTTIYGTYHFNPDYPGKNCTQGNHQCQGIAKGLPDLSKGYHNYGVEWTSDAITWLIDDKNYGQCNKSQVSTLPPSPMYWILNTAIGGDWGGPPDGTTKWPQYQTIDWVRVYKKTSP